MTNTILFDPPASPPITEVHIWIGHYAGGGEGILSADLPMPGESRTRHMPLIHSNRSRAEEFAPVARRIQSASQHTAARLTKVELRTFWVAVS